VETTPAVPVDSVRLAAVGLKLHVGLVAPLGPPPTAQVRFTVPMKPLVGATVMAEVPLLPALTAAIAPGLGVRLKLAAAELPETTA
jgi:hypothetical protein